MGECYFMHKPDQKNKIPVEPPYGHKAIRNEETGTKPKPTLSNFAKAIKNAGGGVSLVKVADVYSSYWQTIHALGQYDRGVFSTPSSAKSTTLPVDYKELIEVIKQLAYLMGSGATGGELFGKEKGGEFKSIIDNLNQTWEGVSLYPTVESQAAHLIYSIIKNHPFCDGNKRIGSFLFVWLLERNGYNRDRLGNIKVNPKTLTLLAILIAQSSPEEKDLMIGLIVNLIAN